MADNYEDGGRDAVDRIYADDSEAMMVGLLGGVRDVLNRENQEEIQLQNKLNSINANKAVNKAERDAHRNLARTIVEELAGPEEMRRFSAPGAARDRRYFLKENFRQSLEEQVQAFRKEGMIRTPTLASSAGSARHLEVKGDSVADARQPDTALFPGQDINSRQK